MVEEPTINAFVAAMINKGNATNATEMMSRTIERDL